MPKKGTIILVPFPFTDLSGHKVRPALVISDISEKNDIIVIFISSKLPKQISGTDLKVKPSKANRLKVTSLIKCSKVATLDRRIILGELGRLSFKQLKLVNARLRTILGI